MSKAMRIGIDASCWLNRRGFGRYARELVTALLAMDSHNEYVLFLDSVTSRDAESLPAPSRARRVVVRTSAAATRAASADGSRSVQDLWRMRQAVARERDLDLLYFPADYTYFPVRTRAKVVVTKHDMTDRRVPELLFPSWRSRFLWETKIRLAMRRSDLVFTVSETSRRDIVEAFRLPARRVRVVSDAVDAAFTPSADDVARRSALHRYGVEPGTRFLLYVGGISPHKNLDTLVAGYQRWRQQNDGQPDVALVLVGDYVADVFHSSYPRVRDLVERNRLQSSVRFTGYVPDADLRHLYSAADALVLPSFYEGFGLPILEAMACGAPVIASQAGALPEVVGEAGLLFDPHSAEALAVTLARVMADEPLRRELSARGRLRAAQYTWAASARTALAAFRELAG
jgi:glycosyltransferase involved in cell wall biosynthesis